jgi:membrane protein required for colicin V production
LGIFCGLWFYGIAGNYVLDYVSSRALANLIGFCVIFLAVMILGAIVGRILAKLFKWVGLSWLDRLLGGAFGLVRGAFTMVALVTVLMAFAPSPPPRSVVDSKLIPYTATVSSALAFLTPREIKEGFHDTEERVQKLWSQRRPPTPGLLRHE